MPTIFAVSGPHQLTGTARTLFAVIDPAGGPGLHIGRYAQDDAAVATAFNLCEDAAVSSGPNCVIRVRDGRTLLRALHTTNGAWLVDVEQGSRGLTVRSMEEVFPGEEAPLVDGQLFCVGETLLLLQAAELPVAHVRNGARRQPHIALRSVFSVKPNRPWAGATISKTPQER